MASLFPDSPGGKDVKESCVPKVMHSLSTAHSCEVTLPVAVKVFLIAEQRDSRRPHMLPIKSTDNWSGFTIRASGAPSNPRLESAKHCGGVGKCRIIG